MSRPRSRSPFHSRSSALPWRQEDGFYGEHYHSSVHSDPWKNLENINKLEGTPHWDNGPAQGEEEVDHWAKLIEAIGHAGRPSPMSRYNTQDDVQRFEEKSSHSPRRLTRERLSSPEALHYSAESRQRILSPGRSRNEHDVTQVERHYSNRTHWDSRGSGSPRPSQGKRYEKMEFGYHNEEHDDRFHERISFSERSLKSNYREHHPHPKKFRGLDPQEDYRVSHKGFSPHNAAVIVEHDHGILNHDSRSRGSPRGHDPLRNPEHSRSRDPPRSLDLLRNREHSRSRDPPRGSDLPRTRDPPRGSDLPRTRDPPRGSDLPRTRDPPRGSDLPRTRDPPRGSDLPRTRDPPRGSDLPRSRDPPRGSDLPRSRDPPRGSDLPRSRDPPRGSDLQRSRDPPRGSDLPKSRDPPRGSDLPKDGDHPRSRDPLGTSEHSRGREAHRRDHDRPIGVQHVDKNVGSANSIFEKEVRLHYSPLERASPMQGRSQHQEQSRIESHAREWHGQRKMSPAIDVDLRKDNSQRGRVSGHAWEETNPGRSHGGGLETGTVLKGILHHRNPNTNVASTTRMDFTEHETLKIKVDMSRPVSYDSHLGYSSERQLSLDLVNVGRQRLDFLPLLEHSGTYRESAIHSGTFAQEIITLVHHVKENYFQDQGITLNERFSSEQCCLENEDELAEEELELEEMNPVINRPLSGPSSDTQIFCNIGSWQPQRRQVPAPGDLRHDLERRRQQRLEGVKITIAGGSFSQMAPQGQGSESRYEDDERDERGWSEQMSRQTDQWGGHHQKMPPSDSNDRRSASSNFSHFGKIRNPRIRRNPNNGASY